MVTEKARAVFSTDDFELLKKAVLFYSRRNAANLTFEDAAKLSHLMHRLGRISGESPREWR